ncbi:MAG: YraN family protein [Armatimonadota bacterium]
MCSSKSKLGLSAEILASSYLAEIGYKIIDSNYHSRYGEIDIIANENENLVFVEVRCRRTNTYGSPIESITNKKKNNIILTAQDYIEKKQLYDMPCRFDVVEVTSNEGKLSIKEVVKDAFTLDC